MKSDRRSAWQGLERVSRSVAVLMLVSVLGTGMVWAQPTETFIATRNMTTARSWHTATLLRDGKVLIVGGNRDRPAASAEIYDPATGTFTTTGDMTTIRGGPTATLLRDGRVLIAGGDRFTGNAPLKSSAELYDPSTGKFTPTADMVTVQIYGTAKLLNNGKVLIAGGLTSVCCSLTTVANPELYDSSTGTFSLTGTFKGTGDGLYVTGGPYVSAATLLLDGRVLIAGEPTSELYDPVTGTFSLTGAMTTPCVLGRHPSYIGGRTATLLTNGKVLVAGGAHEDCGRFADAELYDPATGTFTATGNMTRVRNNHTATLLPDGTVLIAGGESHDCGTRGCTFGTDASAEFYDLSTGTFAAVGDMTDRRAGHTATRLRNGSVLITGGYFFGGIGIYSCCFASAELYNTLAAPVPGFPLDGIVTESGNKLTSMVPASAATVAASNAVASAPTAATLGTGRVWAQTSGAFTPTGTMAVARVSHTATLLPDGKVLIAGGTVYAPGNYRGTATARAELYDPSTGTFSATGSMTTTRSRHTATLLPNGRVLIVGRDWSAGDDRTAELYDPFTGTFTRTGDTLSAQYAASATPLKSGKVLIAGGSTPGCCSDPRPVSNPELYDSSTGTFALTGTFVGPGDGFLKGGPNSPAVVLLRDGRVLFAAEPFSELYDPVSGTFSATGAMTTQCGRYGPPSYISGRTATPLGSGEVLVTGGGTEDCRRYPDAERYDPASGTFTPVGPMTRERTFHTATPLPDGTVLIAGGESVSGFSLVTEATAESYDPSTGSFAIVGAMRGGRQGHTATVLKDGRVLLAGGVFYADVGVFLGSLDSADLYRPTTLAVPVPGFPSDGVVTEDLRPQLQVHNVAAPRPVGVVRYRFEWSDRRDFQLGRRTGFKDKVPEGGGGDTGHEITEDLAPNTVHFWHARATRTQLVGQTDVIVTSEYSQVRSFKTPNIGVISGNNVTSMVPASAATVAASNAVASAPTADPGVAARPSGVVATASGSGVVLTWIGPSGVTPLRYAISGGDAPHLSTLPVVVTPDASTRYTIPGLPQGHYYFTVSAILVNGLSPPSNEAEVVATGSTSATGPPTGALAVSDGRTFTVTWARGQGLATATMYYVEVGGAPGRADVAILATTQPSITFRADAATYYLRVRAAGGATVSQPSNEVSVSVAPSICTATPLVPVLLPVSTTNGETTISWLPAGGPRADHYRVDGTGPSGPTTMTSLGTGTSLTASLEPGIDAIRVTAINACGASAASNQITFTQPNLVTGPARH